MTLHCPHDDILLSYIAGGLGESWGLAIASHITSCPDCREAVAIGEEIGGILLEDSNPYPLSDHLEELTLEDVVIESKRDERVHAGETDLPMPLREYVGDNLNEIKWQTLGGGVFQHKIKTNDNDQARLLKIRAGKSVPEHGHSGREITLVLSGSYIDNGIRYAAGDVSDFAEDITHQPVAGIEDDCICLIVTDSALKFKGIVPKLFQPFASI
jgi:putative transcriptional regulator